MDLSKKLQSDNPVFYGFGEYAPTNLTHRDMLTKYEKIPSYIYPEGKDVSQAVADEIADSIKKKQKKGKNVYWDYPPVQHSWGSMPNWFVSTKKRD